MYVFGISVPILELLVIFCIVVVIYLVILEIEFRQLKAITKKFDDEEVLLSKEMRELRNEVSELKEVIKAIRK